MAGVKSFIRKTYVTPGGIPLAYLDSGGDNLLLHFFHANGFPTGVYVPLLQELTSQFRIVGLSIPGQDGLGGKIESWEAIADHLTDFISSLNQGPVIGVGHSIGAVCTMIGAVKRPDLFSRLIMLDAVMMPRRFIVLFDLFQRLGKIHFIPLVNRAYKRGNKWVDREQAYNYFLDKTLFLGWEDACFQAYLDHGLRPAADTGLTLVCPPEIEAKVFSTYPLDVWNWPQQIRQPLLLVRGNKSRELSKRSLARFLKECPTAKGTVVSGAGHLFPMEKPRRSRAFSWR